MWWWVKEFAVRLQGSHCLCCFFYELLCAQSCDFSSKLGPLSMCYQFNEVILGDMLFEHMYAGLVWCWLADSLVTVKCVCEWVEVEKGWEYALKINVYVLLCARTDRLLWYTITQGNIVIFITGNLCRMSWDILLIHLPWYHDLDIKQQSTVLSICLCGCFCMPVCRQ